MNILIWRNIKLWNKPLIDEVVGVYINDVIVEQRFTDAQVILQILKNSFCAFYYADKLECSTYYAGEALTNNCWNDWKMDETLSRFSDKLLVDEASIRLLDVYKKYNCQVSFSSYRRYILWIDKCFNIRIPIPFSNQIWAWEWLEENFGYRFTKVWIHLQMNKNDYEKLLRWAKEHNKIVMVYCADEITEKEYDKLIKKLEETLTKIEGV